MPDGGDHRQLTGRPSYGGLLRPAEVRLGRIGIDDVRRSRPRSGADAHRPREQRRPDVGVLSRDRRCHRRPGVRVQAADRVLRVAARRAPARAALHLHPRGVPRRGADPRRQARRHRIDGRALRPRGVHQVRGARRHGQPLSGRRLGDALLRLRRRGPRALPHQQPGQRRPAVARLRRRAAVRPRRPDGRRRVDPARRVRSGGRGDVPERAGGGARCRRRRPDPRPWRRRPTGRRGGGRPGRGDGRRPGTRREQLAIDPLRVVG